MRYILLLLLASSAFVQGARQVTLRLLAFDNMLLPAECFAFDSAITKDSVATPAPVKGYLNHEVVTVTISGNEIVFVKTPNVEDARKPEMQLAKVTLPKGGNRFMLIFLPNGKGTFQIMPLDDSVREFPLGSYRIINLSATPVKLTLEDKVYEYKSGQSALIENAPVKENNHSSMYAFSFLDGKWARIGAGLWPAPGKKRSVQMFFDNPISKRTELRGFRDISPPKPGDVAAAANQ